MSNDDAGILKSDIPPTNDPIATTFSNELRWEEIPDKCCDESGQFDTMQDIESAVLNDDIEKFDPVYLDHAKNDVRTTGRCDELFNDLLSEYINDFVERSSTKNKLKTRFFWTIVLLLTISVCTPIALAVFFAKNNVLSSWQFVASIVAAMAEILTAIMILPKILAKYLFDKAEDQRLVDIITNMQKYNESMHIQILQEKIRSYNQKYNKNKK